MICERCGSEHLKVITTVRRTSLGDMRIRECVYCGQRYDTIDTITHAIKYDQTTMSDKRIDIAEFKQQVANGSEKATPSLRLSLFENDQTS